MLIPYRRQSEYQPVDLEKLRPKDSYKSLIAKRTHSIDALVAEHGRIPADLLIERRCPTCGANDAAPELEKDHMTIVRCRSCDLVYTNPIFDEHHYREMYGSKESYKSLIAKRTHSIDALVAEHGRIPADLLIERRCPTCGANDAAPELEKDHMTIVRCRSCDLVYTNPIFDEHHYREMYGSKE